MEIFTPEVSNQNSLLLPLFTTCIAAGFPSPADDHIDKELDLNEYLINSPSSTFFVRARGDSMTDIGIFDGTLLVVDRSIESKHNKIVIAIVKGEFTVKRLKMTKEGYVLVAGNPRYSPIKLDEDSYVWGVVTSIINQV